MKMLMITDYRHQVILNAHLNFVNYVAIKTCMGNTLFDQICLYIYIYKIFIAVKNFCENFQ